MSGVAMIIFGVLLAIVGTATAIRAVGRAGTILTVVFFLIGVALVAIGSIVAGEGISQTFNV